MAISLFDDEFKSDLCSTDSSSVKISLFKEIAPPCTFFNKPFLSISDKSLLTVDSEASSISISSIIVILFLSFVMSNIILFLSSLSILFTFLQENYNKSFKKSQNQSNSFNNVLTMTDYDCIIKMVKENRSKTFKKHQVLCLRTRKRRI